MSEPPRQRSTTSILEYLLFAIAVVAVGLALSSTSGVDTSNRDLIDTDGYMRYLRVETLLEEGDWFNDVSPRSNYPFGESQHWTRAFDSLLIVLTWLIAPFEGGDALYWAAFVNAPVLLLATGWFYWRHLRTRLPSSVGHLVMLLLMGMPLVFFYSIFGRVDHHAALLLLFVVGFVLLYGVVDTGASGAAAGLGIAMATGLWVSTEFLVPVGLVAATLVVVALVRESRVDAKAGTSAFVVAFGAASLMLVVERGTRWASVEYDEISLVHLALLGAAAFVFLVLQYAFKLGVRRAWLWASVVAGMSAVVLVIAFPGLLRGPFADVDQRVAELWLYEVGELRPAWAERPWSSRVLVLGPIVVGLAAGANLWRRKSLTAWTATTAAWLVVYAVLSAIQVRWSLFAHVLTIGLILCALAPWYEDLGDRRLGIVWRPFIAALLVFGSYGLGAALDAIAPPSRSPYSCALSDVVPALQSQAQTTVFAEQDVGPEILYRTDHNVIATPYHRNSEGILYVHDVMSMPVSATDAIAERLEERSVGLILVCPGRNDILRPEDPRGTFYEALTTSATPEFVRTVELDSDTDYRLFAIEN